MGEFVNLESNEATGVATIRIERPPMNAISKQLTQELAEAAEKLAENSAIGAVVIWGGPKIFAAGADIKEFPAIENKAEAIEFSMHLHNALLAIENLPQVTISAVNGYALGGGCELAMSTDFRFAGEGAVFGQPEVLLGILPGAGGTQRLMRLVGITAAKEINYSGRQVKAGEALDIGLVSKVFPDEDCYQEAIKAAEGYAKGPKSLQYIKRAMMDGLALPLSEAVKVEAEAFGDCFETEDRLIGVQSFLEHGPGKAEFTRE
tara:strand:- start:5359 stop:6144 length:786 start_codon:yes stop_codon:yes gene_type:complete